MTDSVSTAAGAPTGRDVYIDFLRAFSLLVVVAWHWVFTIITWSDDGPHATNPIGFTTGMWAATWMLQVMPLFFYVGGYSHLVSWERAQARGQHIWPFVWVRMKRLAIPALSLFGVWVALGIGLFQAFGFTWIYRAVFLVVSPLWFMAVYLMLVALLPVALWLLKRSPMVGAHLLRAGTPRPVSVMPLGGQSKLVTVEVGQGDDRLWLVLGVTPQGISNLYTMAPQDDGPPPLLRPGQRFDHHHGRRPVQPLRDQPPHDLRRRPEDRDAGRDHRDHEIPRAANASR